jgi:peroxiredoxin
LPSGQPRYRVLGVESACPWPKGTLQSFKDNRYLVVFFTCNHCPYVTGSNELARRAAQRFLAKGVVFVGINSNCERVHPEDDFSTMQAVMEANRYPWIYLRDASQSVALAYGALRTPHFFIFDENRRLVYTGRGVDRPRQPEKVSDNNLERALEELVNGQPISVPLTNPIGCNIKWRDRNAHWMPPESCDLV